MVRMAQRDSHALLKSVICTTMHFITPCWTSPHHYTAKYLFLILVLYLLYSLSFCTDRLFCVSFPRDTWQNFLVHNDNKKSWFFKVFRYWWLLDRCSSQSPAIECTSRWNDPPFSSRLSWPVFVEATTLAAISFTWREACWRTESFLLLRSAFTWAQRKVLVWD